MPSKPKAIPQEYYNENRERFDAETIAIEVESIQRPCDHYFIVQGTDLECNKCNAGWPGLAKFIRVVNGKPLS